MEGLYQDRYNIKSARLPGHDYASSGFYFVTICTHERVEYFGDVLIDNDGVASVALSDAGKIIRDELLKTVQIRPNVELDEWIIMPNHIHVIFVINDVERGFVETCGRMSLQGNRTNQFSKPISGSLSMIVGNFKAMVTKRCRENGLDFAWQRLFYDHIIRNETALHKIRAYIKNNPQMWNRDRNNAAGLLI